MLPIPPIPEILRERPDWTVPSPEWEAWARKTFIDPSSPLFNPLHGPLGGARIGFLLTSATDTGGGTWTQGTGGVCKPSGKPWAKAQRAQQLVEWFGAVPDFLITLDVKALSGNPRSVCALVDHELTHCTQAVGVDGPKFDEHDRPVWTTRPHYAELVDEELSRWGAALGGRSQIVRELAASPRITDEMLSTDA